MFGNLGYQCTKYIDDFGGAESPSKATMAFETLEELFSILGLVSSPEKDCAPSTCMVFLGVHFNTIDNFYDHVRDPAALARSAVSLSLIVHSGRHSTS